jgi:hypothetical protein
MHVTQNVLTVIAKKKLYNHLFRHGEDSTMQDILERSSYYRRIYAIGACGHHLAAAQKSRLNHFFGVPAALISAIVGTTLFATLEQNPDTTWRIIVGLVLILSAVLSTLQTRFNYADAAGKHKTAGTRYSAVRRRLEVFELRCADPGLDRQSALSGLEKILADLEKLAEDLPAIPDSMWNRAIAEYERDNPADGSLNIEGFSHIIEEQED